jgi:hypothetical protein
LHTKITHLQLVIWLAVMAGQLAVSLWAATRRNSALATYLGVQVAKSLCVFAVAHLATWQVYYKAYWVSTFIDYGVQVYLVIAIFACIRKTGIPNRHSALLQVFAGCMFAVAVLTLRFPLENIVNSAWKWHLAIDHVAMYWLCLMLIAAPLYAYMVDSAKDTRLLLTYIGFWLYIAARASAVDIAIRTHLAMRLTHVTEICYLLSLVLWFVASQYPDACHQWDPAQTELLMKALRQRSHPHELSRYERLPKS